MNEVYMYKWSGISIATRAQYSTTHVRVDHRVYRDVYVLCALTCRWRLLMCILYCLIQDSATTMDDDTVQDSGIMLPMGVTRVGVICVDSPNAQKSTVDLELVIAKLGLSIKMSCKYQIIFISGIMCKCNSKNTYARFVHDSGSLAIGKIANLKIMSEKK